MPIISIFNNVSDVYNPTNTDLMQHLEDIRDGEWQDIVLKCRTIKDKEEQDKFKQTMPTTTFSGQFLKRRDDGIIEHSGYIALDLDDVENMASVKRNLELDKYVCSLFVSVGGFGYRVLFKIDPNKHREAFIGIRNYLFDQYNITCVDPRGINISKPYIVSFDPYLYINFNEEIPVFKKYIKETPIKQLPNFVHTDGDFKQILDQIKGRGVNICESYGDWLKIGFALSEKFGEEGRDYFHVISSQSQKYKHIVVDRQYTACLKAKGSSTPVGISTFYYLAKINSINISSEQTKTILRFTKNGKKAGLKKEQIAANLLKFENISGADQVIDTVFDSQLGNDEEEESILHGLEMFISNNFSLKMNEVTGYLEQNGKPQYNSDLNTIFIAAKKVLPKLDYPLMMRLLKSDFIETYNPFFKFFGSDGIAVNLPAIPSDVPLDMPSPLIDMLSSCIINENPAYTSHFTRKWMVGIVSAAHKVHCPLLHALLGPPETGKTEFYRRLLPGELRMYYAESKLDKEKDDELLMCENLVILDDELSGKSKSDANKLKNITSKQHFSLRRPYGDHNESILRLAVLCGTSNILKIMSDPTPNRRIIPILVNDINRELYNKIDKKELFMEAFNLYKAGFDWRISRSDMPYLNKDNDIFESIVKERELIQKYYTPSTDKSNTEVTMTTTEILVELEILTRQRLSMQALGRELDNLGFVKKSVRLNAVQTIKKWCITRNFRTELTQPNNNNNGQNYF